jgi:hypothetical protein
MHMRDIINICETTNADNIVNSDGFEMWFEGSKVVDDQGRPLLVYHGTTQNFSVFSDEDIPYRGGILAFFSTAPEFASNYATQNSGANVMPCYLRSVKPFDFRKDWRQAEYFWEDTGGIQDEYEINRILNGLGHNVDFDAKGNELTEEQFVSVVKAGGWDAIEAPEFVEYLHENGFDSIVLLENGAINFGIFNANQVKSAFSKGFDGDSDDITEDARD